MNSSIVKHLYYPLTQRIKGHRVSEYLGKLKLNERISADELNHLQEKQLRETLKIAGETPFYREHFRKHKFEIDDISNFSLLPTTSKDDLKDNPEAFHNPGCTGRLSYGRTSGSTGIAIKIRYDDLWDQWNQADQLRGRSWHRIYPGTRELDIWGRPFVKPGSELVQRLKSSLSNKKMINCFHLSDKDLEKLVPEIERFSPEIIYSYSTGIGRIAEYLVEEFGENCPIKPRVIIITSEALMPQHKHAISKAFGIDPVNEYGAAECGIIAFQCPEGNLHLSADRILTEIIDADNEGYGQVVITPFVNNAMSFIRYELGDIGRLIDDKCPCGRTLPLFELRGSRLSEMIKTPRGDIVSSIFFAFLARNFRPYGLRQYKVIQKDPTSFHIMIVKTDFVTSKIEKRVIDQMQSFLGEEINATFEYVDEIKPDKSGKLRYFVREDF